MPRNGQRDYGKLLIDSVDDSEKQGIFFPCLALLNFTTLSAAEVRFSMLTD